MAAEVISLNSGMGALRQHTTLPAQNRDKNADNKGRDPGHAPSPTPPAHRAKRGRDPGCAPSPTEPKAHWAEARSEGRGPGCAPSPAEDPAGQIQRYGRESPRWRRQFFRQSPLPKKEITNSKVSSAKAREQGDAQEEKVAGHVGLDRCSFPTRSHSSILFSNRKSNLENCATSSSSSR